MLVMTVLYFSLLILPLHSVYSAYAEGCRFAHATRHIYSQEVIDTQHKLSLMLQSLHRHCLRLLTGFPHHCCPVTPCLHLSY